MPLKEGKRYCVNHPNIRMGRTERFKALVNVEGATQSGTGTIDPGSGLIVLPFVCEECGYLELYLADKTPLEKK
ncbi:MAG TPA: hypothetical protein VIF83_13725 [Gemmatimonadaceae bacterium]|jgi:hypothetical protein